MGLFDKLMTNLGDEYSSVRVDITTGEKPEGKEEQSGMSKEEHDKLENICLATAALSLYTAISDGSISIEEYMEMDLGISKINKVTYIPDDIMDEVKKIYDKQNIKWPEVTVFLDNVSDMDLINMKEGMAKIANATDGIDAAEKQVIEQFNSYIINRNL